MKTVDTKHTSPEEGVADAAGERAKCCVDAGVSACNAMSEKARQIGQNAHGLVRANPWLALGAAAGAGILAGLLLGRGRGS